VSKYPRLTTADIARLSGVSRTTASMVLNGRADEFRISAQTRQRVLEVASEHHFQPSHSARALRSGHSHTLGLIVPELTNSAHASLAQAMEPLCNQAGYQLLIVSSDENPERETAGVEHLLARQIDGLMIVPCSSDARLYTRWSKRLPLVLVDRRIRGADLPFVVTDAANAVTAMVGDALSAGARESCYFGGQSDLSPSIDRLEGFIAALHLAGLEEKNSWIRQWDYRRSSGYQLMEGFFQHHGHYPELLFTGSITLLEGVLSFISERRHFALAPSRIITFDDHDLLDCLPVRIDAIRQDSREMARASLGALLMLMEQQKPENVWVPAVSRWRTRDGQC
jgi:LacI family sucrose operon transcriptional repressor